MNIAIISDIHGNLVALNAVLDDIASRGIEHIVCLGDVAALGPQPREVIDRLKAIGCPVIMGNTDAWLLEPQLEETKDQDKSNQQEVEYWGAQQLSPSDQQYIRGFQPAIELALSGGKKLLCFHGSPRSFNEIIHSATTGEDLEPMLAGFKADIMAGGHTHFQMFRRYKDILLLNPGSVGLSLNGTMEMGVENLYNVPWAEYAIIHSEGDGLGIEMLRDPFDLDALIQSARDSGMPHVEWWIKDWHRAQ